MFLHSSCLYDQGDQRRLLVIKSIFPHSAWDSLIKLHDSYKNPYIRTVPLCIKPLCNEAFSYTSGVQCNTTILTTSYATFKQYRTFLVSAAFDTAGIILATCTQYPISTLKYSTQPKPYNILHTHAGIKRELSTKGNHIYYNIGVYYTARSVCSNMLRKAQKLHNSLLTPLVAMSVPGYNEMSCAERTNFYFCNITDLNITPLDHKYIENHWKLTSKYVFLVVWISTVIVTN